MNRLRGVTPVVVLAVTALVLGVWGFSRLKPDLGLADTLYQALQLFNLEAPLPESGLPWQLEIARFLAPFALVYAVFAAFLSLAGEQIQRWRARWFARGHTLVIGDGRRAQEVARSLRDGRHVVALKQGFREEETLREHSAPRAAEIIVATGDDSLNLEVLAAVRECVKPEQATAIHVEIDNPATWTALHRLPLQRAGMHRRIEFVSVPDRSARHLVQSARDRAADAVSKLVVYGEAHTAARVVVHALRSPLLSERPAVVLAGADAERIRHDLAATDSWVLDRADVTVGDEPATWAGAGLAFVCGLREAEALGAALALEARVDPGATIHLSVLSAGTARALETSGLDLSRIELTPGGDALVGEDLLRAATFEQIARERHEIYMREQLARGDSPGDNNALRPWNELDEEFKESNRDYAAGVAGALGRLGAELVPLNGRVAGELSIPRETLDEMAAEEHERWMRDLERRGWRHGAEKDERQKIHPCLVHWDKLEEDDREKDRDSIRALPELLALAGYEIRI